MKTKSALIMCLLYLLTACNLGTPNPTYEASSTTPTSLPFPTDLSPSSMPIKNAIIPSMEPMSLNESILELSSQVIQALKNQDFISLSSYVHPGDGVRFSPYAYVKDTDQVFTNDKVANTFSDNSVYTWGAYAGTGESIDLSFPDYYSKFIYDVDFANAPQVALNHRLSSGNSIDNSAEFYPGSMIVEYYFPGFDPQYEGLDWRSLRLVFSEYNSTWFLAGVIHDEWTP
jgi:hypothetical protein